MTIGTYIIKSTLAIQKTTLQNGPRTISLPLFIRKQILVSYSKFCIIRSRNNWQNSLQNSAITQIMPCLYQLLLINWIKYKIFTVHGILSVSRKSDIFLDMKGQNIEKNKELKIDAETIVCQIIVQFVEKQWAKNRTQR